MTATEPAAELSQFEDKAVTEVGIEIPGAAGGLRDAMKVDPHEFRQGDEAYVVLRCICVKVRHEPTDKDKPKADQRRVHVFDAQSATIIDSDVVVEAIKAQEERILLAREAEQGVQRLEFDESDGDGPGMLADGETTDPLAAAVQTEPAAADDLAKRRTSKRAK